ncbi:MAG: ABC transporter ATP-binding protein [Clostridia bacterium]|nr:ABC transporter ATP-binding protein [Clostridia bacterium]
MFAVRCENVSKIYKNVTALKDCNLQVSDGELFGLLGVNGAGKTTLIKILCGLTPPTSGNAFVFDKSVKTDINAIKKIVDVSPQETSVAGKLTVEENLKFFAEIYYADKAERARAVERVVETFSLGEVLSRRAKTLSGGWQRRLSIAVALISQPKVLFLDEPTLGLDVLARRELWQVIKSIKGKTTIILTSHYLEEIEALCDRVAILSSGKLLASGTAEEIKNTYGKQSFEDAFVAAVTGERV